MDLILWRHAEAEDAGPGQRDLDRALTPHGQRQAARMAQWLNARLPDAARVVASPARRTQQTALALGRQAETLPELAPDSDVESVLQASGWPSASQVTVLVGHQPTLGLLAARLLTGRSQSWSIRKGAVWWFRSRDREAGEVLLLGVQSPEQL